MINAMGDINMDPFLKNNTYMLGQQMKLSGESQETKEYIF